VFHALIMAGGSGTRLWPLSRKMMPKQALALLGDRTMFQVTVERLAPIIPIERVHVVTNEQMAEIFRLQLPRLPQENFVIEPSARDSGPAAALGIARILRIDPDATIAILSADHHIGNVEGFLKTLILAGEVAQQGYIVTLGITPTSPSTGFGYIERGVELAGLSRRADGLRVYEANRFAEKPSLEIAREYVAGGAHSWNAGMFILRGEVGWSEFVRQQAPMAAAIQAAVATFGAAGYAPALAEAWAEAPRKSIDFAIMEGARKVAVIPVDIQWSDIGNWATLLEVLSADANGNVVVGDHLGRDTENSLVRSDNSRLIVTIGVNNLVIVDTPDALLIAPVDRVHEVREIVERLKAEGRTEYL
jgi:mannose-1-phosphate guanylyltransferase